MSKTITTKITVVEMESTLSLTETDVDASGSNYLMGTASANETVMDKQFLVDNRYRLVLVNSKDIPEEITRALGKLELNTDKVHVFVNRNANKLELITPDEFGKLEWHERIAIYKSVLPQIKKNRLISLFISAPCTSNYDMALKLIGATIDTRAVTRTTDFKVDTSISDIDVFLRVAKDVEEQPVKLSETATFEQLDSLKNLARVALTLKKGSGD